MTFQDFVVLGIIPGTQVQITFQLWLQALALIVTLLLARAAWHRQRQIGAAIFSLYFGWELSDWQPYGLGR